MSPRIPEPRAVHITIDLERDVDNALTRIHVTAMDADGVHPPVGAHHAVSDASAIAAWSHHDLIRSAIHQCLDAVLDRLTKTDA